MIKKLLSFSLAFLTMILPLQFNSEPIEINAASVQQYKVMPLGDSITDGFSTVGGYRVSLCNLLQSNSQSQFIDFVGPNWGGNCYDPQHAGYSGYSIDSISSSITGGRTGISSFIDGLMSSYPADVVMLQIGTNDILSLYELDNIGLRLENLVDKVLNYIPSDGILYLATIPFMDASNNTYILKDYFTVESMDSYVNNYNQAIRELVAKKQKEDSRIFLADINSVLTKADLFDGVHPTEAGYAKMGAYWYSLLTKFLVNRNSVSNPYSGDINNSGKIENTDLALLNKYILEKQQFTHDQFLAADISSDGSVDIRDNIILKRYILYAN